VPNRNMLSAYSKSQSSAGNPRQTEARALTEAARRLATARERFDTDRSEYEQALRLNWRLWTIIQADVSSAENPLPPDLRANIISLSIFIDKQTLSALGEPNANKLGVLIDINRNIAAGLMTDPAQAAAGEQATQSAGA
jgi:flagellar protein FlaF